MEDETQVEETTLEPQETVETVEVVEEQDDEDIQARLAKAEELAKNYKIRAEKAEAKAKEAKKEPSAQPTANLSPADLIAVTRANVEPEDLDEVIEYANLKKIPLHEALKTTVVQAILAEKAELRKSASATHTASARRASTQVTEERLLANARTKGELPDSDDDIARLVLAGIKSRRGG